MILFLLSFFIEMLMTYSQATCSSSPFDPQDRRPNVNTLRIGTFNTEFLFLNGGKALQCPGKDCDWKNQDMAQSHLNAIAKLMYTQNVDVWQLSEIEDCDVLNQLVDQISLLGDATFRAYMIPGIDSYTGQNVGLVTRVDPISALVRSIETVPYPIPETLCGNFTGKRGKSKSVSKHFVTRLLIVGLPKPITIIGVHFLAFPTNKQRCFQREAQATVIGALVQAAADIGDDVIILGDFNDFDEQVPDIQSSVPISSVLSILKSAGNGQHNVAQFADQSHRYTNWWDKNNDCVYRVPFEVSSIDHILISSSLLDVIDQVEFGNTLFTQGCSTLHSDHFPLMVTLRTSGTNSVYKDQFVQYSIIAFLFTCTYLYYNTPTNE